MFDPVALVEVGRKAAGVDATLLSDDELLAGVEAMAQHTATLAAARGHFLTEIDARGITDRDLGLTTASWWSRTAGLPPAAARSQVKVARTLRRAFPLVDEALADGRISAEHARVLVAVANPRIVDQLVQLQIEILDLADRATFDAWEKQVRGLANLLDQDGGYDPDRDPKANTLRFHRQFDGTLHLDAILAGDLSETVKTAVEARADDLFHRYQADRDRCPDIDVPRRPQLLALALAELVREGQATDLTSTTPPRPEVTLVGHADDPTDLHADDGTPLDDDTSQTFACDADWYPVIVDSLGVPLDAGRTIRHATRAQRRAMALRDGGCVFPGCDAPATWTDAHHVRHWARHHGTTDITNLAGLCRRHHGVTHRAGWTMHATPDGWFWWQTPTGHTMWSQRHGTQRSGPAPPPSGTPPP